MLTYAFIRTAKALGGFDNLAAAVVFLGVMFSLDMGAVVWLVSRIIVAQ